ncbi:glycosyltransferase family 39 protein [bacterium]|nr:glycosyltransferase family 39 protein [bacterium]
MWRAWWQQLQTQKIHWGHWSVIVLIALLVRVWQFGRVPVSLYWDEQALLYDAWSIAQTGRDYHGQFLPLVAFNSFGDFKPSGYFYAVALVLQIVGAREWAVRVPSLLSGVISVILIGIIADKMWGGKRRGGWRVGEIAALVAAINPAFVHLSHVGFETHAATCWLLAGVALLYPRDDGRWSWQLLGGELCLLASFYTYHATRVIAPLLGIYLLAWNMWRAHTRQIAWRENMAKLAAMVAVAAVGVMPLVWPTASQSVTHRLAETSIFAQREIIEASNQCRALAGDTWAAKWWCHRYWFWAREMASRWSAHLNLDYLFWRGDENWRHSIHWAGVFFPWEAIGLFLGLVHFGARRRQGRAAIGFLIFWLMVALLPASVTLATPHLLRSLSSVPVLIIAVAAGWWWLAELMAKWRWRQLVTVGIVAVYAAGTLAWQYAYTHWYAAASGSDWQDGYEAALAQLRAWQEKYPDDPVYITRELGRPSVYYFWENKIDPQRVQATAETAAFDQGEYLNFAPEHVSFGIDWHEGPQLVMITPAETGRVTAWEASSEVHNSAGEVVLVVGRSQR